MAAGPWQLTNTAITKFLNGTFAVGTDTFKVALFLSTSNLSVASTTFAGVTNEHAASGGYSAGGYAVTLTLTGTTTVVLDFDTDPVIAASGGNIVARFAAIYEVGGDIVAFCLLDDTPDDVTIVDGTSRALAAHATNGIGRFINTAA